MGTIKKQLVAETAEALHSYGYTVYIAGSGEYGFYTDGARVVSFGGSWEYSLDFSGKYISSHSGIGWQLEGQIGVPTKEQAAEFIKTNAPRWATTENVKYTTPEQHLARYGASSKYAEYGKPC